MYCEIFINLEVLIFMDFVVHLNHENKKSNEIQFSPLTLSFKPQIKEPIL